MFALYFLRVLFSNNLELGIEMALKVLAYVLGRRRDEVFLKLKNLLEPFEITRFYTDD